MLFTVNKLYSLIFKLYIYIVIYNLIISHINWIPITRELIKKEYKHIYIYVYFR